MTDTPQSLQFAGATATPQPSDPAQAAESSTQGGQAQSVNEQQYLTETKARELFDAMFNSKGQSIAAKTENRIRKVLEAAQAQGVSMTPEQARSLVDTADAAREQPTQPQQAQPTQAQTQPVQRPEQADASQAAAEAVHPVIAVANQMLAEAGIDLADDDPEHSLIDKATNNPAVFLASIQAAIDAKKARQSATGSPARIPALSGGGRPANPIAEVNDPNELWKLATRK